MGTRIPLLTLLGLSACIAPDNGDEKEDDREVVVPDTADADTDADADADADTEPASCWDVSPDACAGAGCQELVAWPVTLTGGDAYCVDTDAREVVGCMPSDMGCGAVLSHATPPDTDECWLFPDSCMPTEWANGCVQPGMEVIEDCP